MFSNYSGQNIHKQSQVKQLAWPCSAWVWLVSLGRRKIDSLAEGRQLMTNIQATQADYESADHVKGPVQRVVWVGCCGRLSGMASKQLPAMLQT